MMNRSSKILVLVGLATGLLAVVVAAMLPSKVRLEQSIVIHATPINVFDKINRLLIAVRWNGQKGKDSTWIEDSVKNKSIKCGLNKQSIGETFYSEFTLQPAGDSTKLTSAYTGDMGELEDRLAWLYIQGPVKKMHERMLSAIKKVSEREVSVTDSTQTK
jgi:hypothetical protein